MADKVPNWDNTASTQDLVKRCIILGRKRLHGWTTLDNPVTTLRLTPLQPIVTAVRNRGKPDILKLDNKAVALTTEQ